MAKLLVGIDINNKESNPDFTINLPDEVIEQVEYMYKRAFLGNLVWMKKISGQLTMSN